MLGGAAALIAPIALEIDAALHLECIRERSDRPLSLATGRQPVRHRTRRRSAAGAACDLPRPERLSAGRRADAQAGAGASRADRLQKRARDFVDAIEMGEARERDGRGRPLPKWQGCRVVGEGELFVMNWQSANSLDGRYFGFLPASAVDWPCAPSVDLGGLIVRVRHPICHSSVRPSAAPFLRPDQRLRGRRAQRRSRAAERPARSGFTLDGREHDGTLAFVREEPARCRTVVRCADRE